MHKCRSCICKTCMNNCAEARESCGCQSCSDSDKAVRTCDKYCGFSQIRLFSPKETAEKKPLPRDVGWKDYGLENKKYRKKLKHMCQSKKYARVARSAAYLANPDIAEYILLSVIKNKTYEQIEYVEHNGKPKRIPCGRTDFYGYRRMFYYYFERGLNPVQDGMQI